MDKKTLKEIVQQLKSIVDLLESEVYSDISSWTTDEQHSNKIPTYAEINDEDGDYD